MSVNSPPAPPAAPRHSRSRPNYTGLWLGDLFFRTVTTAAALLVPLVLVLLIVFLVRESSLAFERLGLSFFTRNNWDPIKADMGAVPFVFGTLVTSALAMLIAVPLSVGAATYLAEIAPGWFRRAASFLIELLAAIPSVVYGFWGFFFVVPLMQSVGGWFDAANKSGSGILTASIILAIMVVPYIAAITYDVCRAVPSSQREGALALGSTRWQMIWRVVLPFARPGIVGACFLALGRALGETMAVAMVIGNRPQVSDSLFAAGATIPSIIANQMGTAASDLHASALVALGLVLLFVTIVVNCLARLLLWRVGRMPGRGKASAPTEPEPIPARGPRATQRPADPPPRRLVVSRAQRGAANTVDVLMTGVLGACLLTTLIPLFHIFGYITLRGFRSVDVAFFTNTPYDDPPGLGHAMLGSAIMVSLATAAAVPIGILAALFLTEYQTSRLSPVVRFVGELLGGVPSVILGIFAYALLVRPYGFSAWAGALALAVMMVPIVMRGAEEALKLVPLALRNASSALGASHFQTVWRVLLPTALPTIITGVFLAIARVAGETAPLLFTAFNSNFWPKDLGERTPFLTYYIYNYSMGESAEEQRQAWAGALVLLVLVMAVNVGIRLITGKRALSATRAD